MKTQLIPLLLLAALNLAHADEMTATLPSEEQARSTWQAMTPEQQAAAKTMVKEQGQEKKAAWGDLSDEGKAAKQATAKAMLQPYRTAMQARMVSRPYGHR
jgi:hypothetical protein